MKGVYKHAAVLLALAILLTWLFNESRDADRQWRRRLQDQLRTIELHDAQLSRDALLTRAGQLPNYDPLMHDRLRLRADLAALEAISGSGSSGTERLVHDHRIALETAVNDKLAQVEQFKTGFARTRNSLAYLTRPAAALDDEATSQRLRAGDSARLQQALLRFIPTLEAPGEVRAQLDAAGAPFAEDSLPNLLLHGRLIVAELPAVDATLRQLVEVPTSKAAKDFEGALLAFDAQAETRAQVVRYALYFFSLLLLGYLVHLFMLIRASARRLTASHASLQLAVAEQAQTEVALKASEQRFRSITQFANEAIFTVDAQGNIVSWNVGATQMFGYQAGEILNRPLTLLMPARPGRVPGQGLAHWRDDERPAAGTVEATGVRRDGSEFAVEIGRSKWSTPQGAFETGIVRDISERRRLQAIAREQELQLAQANRMTSIGLLVSGVAHEVSNPNQWIMHNASAIEKAWADAIDILDEHAQRQGPFTLGGLPYEEMRQKVPEMARGILEGTRRIAAIVANLKDFARPRLPGVDDAFDLDESVLRAIALLRWLIRQRTERFSVEPGAGLPPARGNAGQIEQVIVNLLTNALESLPDTARAVSVRTRFDAAADRLQLIVEDEGCGIAPEHLAHLCDPFFTTRREQGGTGLGLAISASIVRAHHGTLDYESVPGQGTRATLSLQRASAQGAGAGDGDSDAHAVAPQPRGAQA